MEPNTKECLYCHKPIPDYTDKCPHCGKRQISKPRQIVLNILLGVMVVSFGGMLFLRHTESRESDYSGSSQVESKQQETVAPSSSPPASIKGTYKIGDTFTTSNVGITLNSVSEWQGEEYDEYFLDENTEYLMLNFTVQNDTDDEISTYDIDFNGYVDNQNVDLEFVGDDILAGNDLLPGTYEKGYIGFIVPKNWNNFQVRVEKYNSDGAVGTFNFNRSQCTPYPNAHHSDFDHEHDYDD